MTAPTRAALAERLTRWEPGCLTLTPDEHRVVAALLREPEPERQVELETCDHPCVDCAAEDAEPRCADCASRLVMSPPTDEAVARAMAEADLEAASITATAREMTDGYIPARLKVVRAVRAAESKAKEASR